jgi:hypothetical protein
LFGIHYTLSSEFNHYKSYNYFPFVSLFQPSGYPIPCKIIKSAKNETNLFTLFAGGIRTMPKRTPITGEKNLISKRLIELRRQRHMSQRLLAYKLQLHGYDMDKNVITRIETNKRYVTDIELKALTEIFDVSYEYLIEGKDILEP